MKSARCAGFTLAELLVVVAIIGATAAIVVPTLSYGDANTLSLAASETGNALRLARSEAVRSGRAVLVDAGSAPGHLQLWYADCTTAGPFTAVIDPTTRRAADVAIAGSALSGNVAVTAAFVAAAGTYAGLVFDATGAALRVCDTTTTTPKGTPQPGSGITITSGGGSSVAVTVDPPTGRVTWP